MRGRRGSGVCPRTHVPSGQRLICPPAAELEKFTEMELVLHINVVAIREALTLNASTTRVKGAPPSQANSRIAVGRPRHKPGAASRDARRKIGRGSDIAIRTDMTSLRPSTIVRYATSEGLRINQCLGWLQPTDAITTYQSRTWRTPASMEVVMDLPPVSL